MSHGIMRVLNVIPHSLLRGLPAQRLTEKARETGKVAVASIDEPSLGISSTVIIEERSSTRHWRLMGVSVSQARNAFIALESIVQRWSVKWVIDSW